MKKNVFVGGFLLGGGQRGWDLPPFKNDPIERKDGDGPLMTGPCPHRHIREKPRRAIDKVGQVSITIRIGLSWMETGV